MVKQDTTEQKISIILPAKNEERGLKLVLEKLRDMYRDAEIIVVNDGSTDATAQVALDAGATVLTHPYSKGNGAAIKTGARHASGDILVFMDSDGQHRPEDISRLLNHLNTGYDMVVGARSAKSQASMGRWAANSFYNTLSSWMVGQKIADLTSGFRVARAEKFKEFINLLPNKFSYPTTSTMAFFRAGYSVGYEPIVADERIGKSHISLVKDGIRFLLIIFKIGTLYSPLKLFLPISFAFFCTALGYYSFTYMSDGRFTNMGMLLFVTSILIFLMGLVSEQITALMYKDNNK